MRTRKRSKSEIPGYMFSKQTHGPVYHRHDTPLYQGLPDCSTRCVVRVLFGQG